MCVLMVLGLVFFAITKAEVAGSPCSAAYVGESLKKCVDFCEKKKCHTPEATVPETVCVKRLSKLLKWISSHSDETLESAPEMRLEAHTSETVGSCDATSVANPPEPAPKPTLESEKGFCEANFQGRTKRKCIEFCEIKRCVDVDSKASGSTCESLARYLKGATNGTYLFEVAADSVAGICGRGCAGKQLGEKCNPRECQCCSGYCSKKTKRCQKSEACPASCIDALTEGIERLKGLPPSQVDVTCDAKGTSLRLMGDGGRETRFAVGLTRDRCYYETAEGGGKSHGLRPASFLSCAEHLTKEHEIPATRKPQCRFCQGLGST